MAVRILFGALGNDATSCHRILYPLEALRKEGYEHAPLRRMPSSLDKMDEELKDASLVLFQCLIATTDINLPVISRIQKQGVKVIIDYDDDFSSLPQIKLDQIGKSQQDITSGWRSYLDAADLITASTQMLANRIKSFTKTPVKVLPNLIRQEDFDLAKDTDPFDDLSEIRILYSCSNSHLLDFKFISPVLKWIGEHHPKVKIISQGGYEFTYLQPRYSGKAKHYLRIPYSSYYQSLLDIKPHIFIAPLRINQHNVCRSDLKYLQAATIKAAFVGTNLPPYQEIKKKTGILTNTRLGWWWSLRKLIKNLDKAKAVGQAAHRNIREHFILEDHIRLWSDTYNELL